MLQYRKDINGLRALAVIAVVLFHFKPSWVPGGFAGVDVFFVISGFLMTSIIFTKLENNNFSILEFYLARANRIIPALAVLCVTLVVLGWIYLTPLDYRSLSKQVTSSILFISNITYWQESGYFDRASLDKWLLHTWSLSVEWQFYIVYPLVLVFLKKLVTITIIKKLVLISTVLGFIFSIIATHKWPGASYYLLPTRAWELMLGGVAFLYPLQFHKNTRRGVEWIGLGAIVLSYFLISKVSAWPGYLALIPVMGTFFVIQANHNSSLITSNPLFQAIGTWSYSIYLWHWPLVVIIYYYSLNSYYVYLGIILSLLFGYLSNKYVEKIKIETKFISISSLIFKYKPLHFTFLLASIGLAIYVQSGFLSRLSGEMFLKNKSAMEAVNDWYYPTSNLEIQGSKFRFIKGRSEKNILFIGASHIEQTYSYVELINRNFNIYYLTQGGCFISASYSNPKWSCSNIQNYKDVLNNIKFDVVVTSIYGLDGYLSNNPVIRSQQVKNRVSEYNEFLAFANQKSEKVFLILGEPKGVEFDPVLSVRNKLKTSIDVQEVRNKYKVHYDALKVMDEVKKLTVIDPLDFLCGNTCEVLDEQFNYYYKDKTHMRPFYSKMVMNYLDPIFL
jgi:peptidoglycan/LPS O-acetylase OafA/YrhL